MVDRRAKSGRDSGDRRDEEQRIPPRRALRPPLDSMLNGKWNITGDVSWLLDFAIVGFPKCGTSTLMHHLGTHPEIRTFHDERCDLSNNRQALLVRDLYELPISLNGGVDVKRGIKCPFDLENTKLAMPNYRRYFPSTDFIVGIRHPVLWFESFYNFRVHNEFPMLPPEKLIGKCRRGSFNVCTARANFHLFLSNFGKTDMATSADEHSYVDPAIRKSMVPFDGRRWRVFLYEVSQLSGDNEKLATQFRYDLMAFLRLSQPISPMIWFKPGRQHEDQRTLDEVNSKKIDICSPRYGEYCARSILPDLNRS